MICLFHNFPSSGEKFFYLIKWWLQQVFICAFIHTIIYLIVVKFVQCQWVKRSYMRIKKKRSYMHWGSYKRSRHVLEEIPLTQIWNKLSFIFGSLTKNIRLKDSTYVEVWRMSELGGHMGLSWWPFFLQRPTWKPNQQNSPRPLEGNYFGGTFGGVAWRAQARYFFNQKKKKNPFELNGKRKILYIL